MPDLASELRYLADHGAGNAIGLPVEEVMRGGDRRRRRRRLGTLAALTAAGLAAVAAAAFVPWPGSGPARHAASAGRAGTPRCTLSTSTAVSAGRVTVCADYVTRPGGDIVVRAVRARATFRPGSRAVSPYFVFSFGRATSGLVDDQFTAPQAPGGDGRHASSGLITSSGRDDRTYFHGTGGLFPGNEVLTVTVRALSDHGVVLTVAVLRLTLIAPGRGCPAYDFVSRAPGC